MPNKKLIKLAQKRIANISISASAARGMRPNTIGKARKYLIHLKLSTFSNVQNENVFIKILNHRTNYLRNKLPKNGRKWGSARKFLNIFLEECFYNRYICKEYGLGRLRRWLEVPLDRQVTAKLKKEQRRQRAKELPRWKGVIHLQPADNKRFQDFAKQVAQKKGKGVARVHLDLFYWRS
ncbi:MAG: hypothetical protein WCC11_06550 [Gammaproteobacteria bacterium]